MPSIPASGDREKHVVVHKATLVYYEADGPVRLAHDSCEGTWAGPSGTLLAGAQWSNWRRTGISSLQADTARATDSMWWSACLECFRLI